MKKSSTMQRDEESVKNKLQLDIKKRMQVAVANRNMQAENQVTIN